MKRFWSLFAAVALLAICLAIPKAEAAPSVYFTALNDQLLPLQTNTMAIVRSGTVYLPSPVFGMNNIGVFVSKTAATLTLYGRQKILTFDLETGGSHDLESSYSAQTISRNGMLYVPAYFISKYFDLEYSYLSTDYGTVVRIKNTDASLNDTAFLRSVSDLMQEYYAAYTQTTDAPTSTPVHTATPTPVKTPAPTRTTQTPAPTQTSNPSKTPAPTVPVSGAPSPSVSPSPSESPVPSAAANVLYLGIQVTDTERTGAILNLLDQTGSAACFFFAPDQLANQGELARRVIGSGYSIGLYVTQTEPVQTAEQGNRVLLSLARTAAVLVACPNGTSEQRAALQQAGYALYLPAVTGSAALQQVADGTGGVVRMLLADTDAVGLSALLSQWKAGGHTLRPMTETSR